jgi:hypothetical protein
VIEAASLNRVAPPLAVTLAAAAAAPVAGGGGGAAAAAPVAEARLKPVSQFAMLRHLTSHYFDI